MQYLKQSTAATIMLGPFVDKTDGVTLKTDATTITDIDHATTGIFLSKAGAAAAVRTATVTASVADAYGMMKVTLNTTDTGTVGMLDVLFAKAATYLPVHKSFMVLPAQVYDSIMGTDLLQVDVTQLLNTAWLTPGTAGTPDVNVKTFGGGIVANGSVPNVVAGNAGGLFIAGTNAATTVSFTGNLSGSVGSVTGAVGSVTGNVGGSVASVTGNVGGVTGSVTVGTNNDKTDYELSSAGVTAIWAETMTGTVTAVKAMRGFIAAMLGKVSGTATNAPVFRDADDTKNVITATTDADGNRTAVTLDLT